MKTSVVYVVISNDEDVYLEQAWASAFSVKMYTPSAKITILTDKASHQSILSTDRRKILGVVDNIVSVDFDDDYQKMEQSRWIKTNLRSLIEGDFLFVDSDTIVCGDISGVDNLDCSVGAVLDLHCHFDEFPFKRTVNKWMKKIYNEQLEPQTDYFNSGVMYVKDNDEARNFFNHWHNNWRYSLKKGYAKDQLSLVKTCNDLGNIAEIDGAYNCQLLGSIKYLSSAKIVHFFNTKWGQPSFSPFFEKEIYSQIKKERAITPVIDGQIRNCRASFITPTATICKEDFDIWHSNIFNFLRWLYLKHKKTYTFILRSFNLLERILNLKEKTGNL